MKWVVLRPEIDPLTGDSAVQKHDARWSGASPADLAALELALRIAHARATTVHVVTVGAAASETMLRDALASGARNSTRIDASSDCSSHDTARLVAQWSRATNNEFELVVCGDWSLDRGSGSFPVFLAHELGIENACGLVSVDTTNENRLRAERRLDGGRRELLEIRGPAVLSVEGAAATLRRSALRDVLAASKQTIDTWRPTAQPTEPSAPLRTGPYRPRARVFDGPDTSLSPLRRVEVLTGALTERTPPRKLTLDPPEAAATIVAQLREWGYLP